MGAQSMAITPDIREGDRRRWLILSVLVVAQFMVVLDVAIVNVALPTIKNDLHFSENGLQWVITAYAILFVGVVDRLPRCAGPRRGIARTGGTVDPDHDVQGGARPQRRARNLGCGLRQRR